MFKSALLIFIVFSAGILEAKVVINEFMASNGSSIQDENGDREDWLELYNTTAEDIDLEGWSLSDDISEPRKWIFPSVTLPARGYLLIWLSGEDRVALAPREFDGNSITGFSFEPTNIEREAEWRYLVPEQGQVGPPFSWAALDFDDSDWPVGRSGFGHGDEDDSTEFAPGPTTVWTRKRFEIADLEQVSNLVLSVDYDDGFVAYLNGSRVAGANSPHGFASFAWEATGEREAGFAERFDLSPFRDLLVTGTNVLAVVGLDDADSESPDMTLEVELGMVPSVIHTNFQLDRSGEDILITDPTGELIDGVSFPEQERDRTYGRFPNATGDWKYLLDPTPAFPNETLAFDEPVATEIDFSPAPGKYPTGAFQVELSAEPAGRLKIRYTRDGTTPTATSPLYIRSLQVDRNSVIRAGGFLDGELVTKLCAASYFVGPSFSGSAIDLPILSISMKPADYRWIQENTGARGRSSERAGHFEYFEAFGNRLASTGFGMRLHGGAGRGGNYQTKKAYKAYFRGVYGDTKLRARVIPETSVDVFDKLVLRSNFNDSFRTNSRASLIRDELIRDIHEDTGALVSHGSWCVLYVNMEFRGIYNIVERMDEEFCESYLGGEDWDVIKTGNDVLVGTSTEWSRLRNFIVRNDLSDYDLYRQALDLLDIENFTSYMLVNMWAQNHDWPHNNWYAARPRKPDGKWIFLCWDAEFGIGLHPGGWGSDTLSHVLGRGGYLAEIFSGLLDNPIYRAYVRQLSDFYAIHVFDPSRVQFRIQSLEQHIQNDFADESRLMGAGVSQWHGNIDAMEAFANGRRDFFRGLIQSHSRLNSGDSRTPILLEVRPKEVINTGTATVAFVGQNLTTVHDYYIGGQQVTARASSRPGQVNVTLPFGEEFLGPLDVQVVDSWTQRQGFLEDAVVALPPRPKPTSITPDEGVAVGGETVEIRGSVFLPGVKVFFGDVESPSVTRNIFGAERLKVVTPPGGGTVAVRVVNTRPDEYEAETTLTFKYDGIPFLRGDANESGTVDLSDAVALLNFLFGGGVASECHAALDADLSRVLDLSDALTILGYLFLNGPVLPAPFPDCDTSPNADELECVTAPESCL